MLTRVVQTVLTAVFFRTYFDLVNQFELFQARNYYTIVINPLSVVGEYDTRGIQAIHHAVRVGHLGATTALIEQFGADINARTTSDLPIDDSRVIPAQSTPLIISIITRNYEIFYYLLAKLELDLNASTDQFKGPLHFAAEHGQVLMIDALLDRGANIVYLKGSRKSPFHVALENGQLSAIEWFIDNNKGMGPVSSGKHKFLESQIHFLARVKLPADIWIRSLEICLKGLGGDFDQFRAAINRKNLSKLTPLQCAIEESNESGIIGLILLGADVSGASHPLIGAVSGFFGSVGSGVIGPEFVNSDNETIWHLIARINSVALSKGIIHFHPSKPNLRLKNRIRKTALELAVEMQNFEAAFELLRLYDHQIDLELLETLANIAVWDSWPILLENLIKEFHDSFAEMFQTSMEISSANMFLHILVNSSMRADLAETKEMILLLIKDFPQLIRSFDIFGRTPLHLALECEFWEFFNLLKEAKEVDPLLDFNVQNDSGVFFSDLLKEQGQNDILDILNLSN